MTHPTVDLEKLLAIQPVVASFARQFIDVDPTRHDELSALIRPRDEDWARVFLSPWDVQAREGYAGLWSQSAHPFNKPGQTQVLAAAAQAVMLTVDNPLSSKFPGGYRRVADKLHPDRIWAIFKYVVPGERLGMAWDGLVRVDEGRWAWFPKPWRVIG